MYYFHDEIFMAPPRLVHLFTIVYKVLETASMEHYLPWRIKPDIQDGSLCNRVAWRFCLLHLFNLSKTCSWLLYTLISEFHVHMVARLYWYS